MLLDISQFHEISMTKCNHRDFTGQLLGFQIHMDQIQHIVRKNMPNNINKCQKG